MKYLVDSFISWLTENESPKRQCIFFSHSVNISHPGLSNVKFIFDMNILAFLDYWSNKQKISLFASFGKL